MQNKFSPRPAGFPQHDTQDKERAPADPALASGARSTLKPIGSHFGAVLAKARGE